VQLFDEAFDHIVSMLDRDASVNFKRSAIGVDMIRRLSHSKMQQNYRSLLKPNADVTLKVDPIEFETMPVQEPEDDSTYREGRRKRLGTFTLRSKTARQSGSGESGEEKKKKEVTLSTLISPRRNRSSSGRAVGRSVSSGNSSHTLVSRRESFNTSGSRSGSIPPPVVAPLVSPSSDNSSERPVTRDAPSLSIALNRSPRPMEQPVEESPISPRDMLRSDPHEEESPSLSRRNNGMSPRSKLTSLRTAGGMKKAQSAEGSPLKDRRRKKKIPGKSKKKDDGTDPDSEQ
jgi:hypothetical protein